jgi:alpha-tubulin suppressor-like RCC1 family protein
LRVLKVKTYTRTRLARCALAAALLLGALLTAVLLSNGPGIRTGRPLPPGKVRPQLVCGQDAAVLLAPDGSLWAWGGACGTFPSSSPQSDLSEVPLRIGSNSDWAQMASLGLHTVALKNDGSLWNWGSIRQRTAGVGSPAIHNGTPTRIGVETNWTRICAGRDHGLALRRDGSLWAWGGNDAGQLGDGTTDDNSAPVMIGKDRDWRTILATASASFALKNNGTLWAWGYACGSINETPRQIAPETNWLSFSVFGDTGDTLAAIKTDGTLWLKNPLPSSFAPAIVLGSAESFTQIGLDRDWAEVHAGQASFLSRKKDGSWWGCGYDFMGQLGLGTNVPAPGTPQRLPFGFDPWAFATGWGTTLVLAKDGRLWTWGARLGAEPPSAARQKFEAFVAPAVARFPSLGFLIKTNWGIDSEPHLLWELPPEVRRSLRNRGS